MQSTVFICIAKTQESISLDQNSAV